MTARHDMALRRPHTPGMNTRKVDMTDEHIKGAAQSGLGDVQDKVRGPKAR